MSKTVRSKPFRKERDARQHGEHHWNTGRVRNQDIYTCTQFLTSDGERYARIVSGTCRDRSEAMQRERFLRWLKGVES